MDDTTVAAATRAVRADTDTENHERLLGELAELLRQVTGEDEAWSAAIVASCRLEADLRLEDIDLVALGELIRGRYGARCDMTAYLATLEMDELVDLTVGDLIGFVAATGGR